MDSVPRREQRLIKAVRSHPCLYDKNAVDYHNKWRKGKAWEAVQAAVCLKLEHCQARWRTLRDRFVRELANKSKTPWVYLEALSFLKPHVARRRKSSSPSVWDQDLDDLKNSPKSSSEGYSSIEKPSTSKQSKRKRFCQSTSPSFDGEPENDMEHTSFSYEYQEETTAPFETVPSPPQEYSQDETYVSALPELASFDSYSSSEISQQSSEVNLELKKNEQYNSLFGAVSECVEQNGTPKNQTKSSNEAYYKVLETYMQKLSEEDQDEIKIDILNMVYKKSKTIQFD